MQDMMEWSRKIVDFLTLRHRNEYSYSINFEISPNPLNYDGFTEVCIQINRKSNKEYYLPPKSIVYETHTHFTINDAMREVEDNILTK